MLWHFAGWRGSLRMRGRLFAWQKAEEVCKPHPGLHTEIWSPDNFPIQQTIQAPYVFCQPVAPSQERQRSLKYARASHKYSILASAEATAKLTNVHFDGKDSPFFTTTWLQTQKHCRCWICSPSEQSAAKWAENYTCPPHDDVHKEINQRAER